MSDPPEKPTTDPEIEAAIERALARYRGLVPADLLEEMRTNLRFGLTTHESAKDIAKRLRERATPDASADVPTRAITDLAQKRAKEGGNDK